LGQRVVDHFTHRISYSHLDAPKKGSDGFQDWMKAFTGWIVEKEKMGHWMVHTDGGFWREKCRGTHAMVATWAGQEISSDINWVLAALSFDAEIMALENAIAWVTNHADIIDKDEVYILTDNKGVIQSFLQLQPRSSQMSALRINIMLTELFTTHPRIKLHFAHCPSHTGVHFKERADKLASTFAESGRIPTGLLQQHFIKDNTKEAEALWKLRSRLSTYKGQQWLAVRRKKKAFVPKIRDKNAKNFFLDLADNDMTAMAQIMCAITNHAPTGEYYSTHAECFPNKETLCTNCSLAVIQTRGHIFTECTKYTNCFPSIRFWTNKKNNGESLKSFLRENPTTFSFSDVPPDIH
jgi:ribonuclease HI